MMIEDITKLLYIYLNHIYHIFKDIITLANGILLGNTPVSYDMLNMNTRSIYASL